jgi:O-antigen/teichoic acid export membrane protein
VSRDGAPPLASVGPRVHTASLGRVASWGVVGNLAYAGCQWGMLVVLAKLGSAEMLGQLALGFAVTAPVFLLTSLSLRGVLTTDVRVEYSLGDYLALRLVTAFIGLAAVASIAGLVDYRWETRVVILAIGVLKAIEAVSDILYGVMQRHDRTDLIARSIGSRGVLSVLALAAGVQLSGSVLWGLLLVAVMWALVLATYDIPESVRLLGGDVRPRWVRSDLLRLARLSIPLGVTAMFISLSATIPRYFIERHRGEQDLGAFVAMAYLVVIGEVIANALGQAASPRLARYYAAGDRARFRRLLVGLVGLGLVLGGSGLVIARAWGRELLAVLYRPEYAEHAEALEMLMLAAGIGYVATFLYYTMTSARLFRVQMPLFVGVAAASLVACAALVPARGVMGAAQASVATAVVNLLGATAVNLYALRRLGAAEAHR